MTKDILSEFAGFMYLVKELGKDWRHLTISIGYSAAQPGLGREDQERILAAIARYFPPPVALLPEGGSIDFIRVSAEIGDSHFAFEFELPGPTTVSERLMMNN